MALLSFSGGASDILIRRMCWAAETGLMFRKVKIRRLHAAKRRIKQRRVYNTQLMCDFICCVWQTFSDCKIGVFTYEEVVWETNSCVSGCLACTKLCERWTVECLTVRNHTELFERWAVECLTARNHTIPCERWVVACLTARNHTEKYKRRPVVCLTVRNHTKMPVP